MAREMETLLAIQAGITPVLCALIATHPDYRALQLAAVGMIEIADGGSGWAGLSSDQREKARHYAEWLLTVRSSQPSAQAWPPATHRPD